MKPGYILSTAAVCECNLGPVRRAAHSTEGSVCLQVGAPPNAPLIAHAATSTTYPSIYHELFEKCVLPFWQQHPPRYRLSKKSYKSIWDKNAVLQERSLTFQVRLLARLQNNLYLVCGTIRSC